jgi:hypothetical protein
MRLPRRHTVHAMRIRYGEQTLELLEAGRSRRLPLPLSDRSP